MLKERKKRVKQRLETLRLRVADFVGCPEDQVILSHTGPESRGVVGQWYGIEWMLDSYYEESYGGDSHDTLKARKPGSGDSFKLLSDLYELGEFF